VPPTALESLRVAGDKDIYPDEVTRAAIAQAGKTRLVIPLKVCVDAAGAVEQVVILKASGFPAYDEALRAGVRAWRYRPFVINGSAVKVCSIVQFMYRQN
jgi:TonB family protein